MCVTAMTTQSEPGVRKREPGNPFRILPSRVADRASIRTRRFHGLKMIRIRALNSPLEVATDLAIHPCGF